MSKESKIDTILSQLRKAAMGVSREMVLEAPSTLSDYLDFIDEAVSRLKKELDHENRSSKEVKR